MRYLLLIVILCLSSCTIKLAKVTQTYDDLDTQRYQIIESYKRGMLDVIKAQEVMDEYDYDDMEGL